MVGLGELEGLLARADLGGDAVQLVVEDVAEALGEDEREDVVLVFRRVLGPADGAGGVPDRIRGICFFRGPLAGRVALLAAVDLRAGISCPEINRQRALGEGKTP